MMNILREGSGQPGATRPLRRDQRSIYPDAEIGLGNVTVTLCVWPRKVSTTAKWVTIFKRVLGRKLVKVRRVRFRCNGPIRYDVKVPSNNVASALRSLKRVAKRYEWIVKIHRTYRQRQRDKLRRAGIQNIVPRLHRLHEQTGNENDVRGQGSQPTFQAKMASWNINHLASKRPEIEQMLLQTKVEILALQETGRDANAWPFRLRGFRVLETVAGRKNLGEHGLAVCISDKHAVYEIETGSPYLLHACCRLGLEEWNVINVYIPNCGENRRKALSDLRASLVGIFRHDLAAKLVVMGDFNTESSKLMRMWQRWRLPLCVVTPVGNPATRLGRNRWSTLDHIVASVEARSYVMNPKVNRTWDLSDHWPLEVVIRGCANIEREVPPSQVHQGLRFNITKMNTCRDDIIHHNRWEVLRDLLEDDAEVDCDVAFTEAVSDIAQNVDVLEKHSSTSSRNHPQYRLSKSAKRAIRRRRKAYSLWLHETSSSSKEALWRSYCELKKCATIEKRKSTQASWLRFVEKGAMSLDQNDMKGFWTWAKQVTHRGKGGAADFGPIQVLNGPEGSLAFTPEDKLLQWFLYYQELLKDVTGHSRDRNYWKRKLPGEAAEAIPGLNGVIHWAELNSVLSRLKSGKAPGCDGIPPSFYKLAMGSSDGLTCGSIFGEVLLKMCNRIFDRGVIPHTWNEAWIVSIFKKGDPKSMDNYRGISLIAVFVKILTAIVTVRLQLALEDRKWFVKAQAGFRTREECVAQACCLYEILCRRKLAGKRTYVAFIDFRKAYDTVPIEALLRKLEIIGVSGKALAYFRALYTNPHIRVKTRYGFSDEVQLLRGLRQGCNASPLLFDIFINELLVNCARFGVQVLGLAKNRRICGLMFADDVVLLAPNCTKLQKALACIQKWAQIFEMSFGVQKCGVMGFGDGAQERIQQNHLRWVLDGQPIPIVTEYVYLGIPFDESLDTTKMAKARAEKGRKALNALRPVLGCSTISTGAKIRLIQALLVPVLSYGSELWGMSTVRAQYGQTVLNEALRALVRLKKGSSITATSTLNLEFGIDPLAITAAAARTRGYFKYFTLRTYIADLMKSPPCTRKWTWVTGSSKWLRRYCVEALEVSSSDAAITAVKAALDSQLRKGSKTTERYLDSQLDKSVVYLKRTAKYPDYQRGIFWLTRLRVNAFWTAKAFQKIKWLPDVFRYVCPFCNQNGSGETIEHLLSHCASWHDERRECIGELIDMGATYINLLGGSRVDSGIPQQELLNLWLESNDSAEDIQQTAPTDTVGARAPGFIQVASFLQRVLPKRVKRLAILLKAPRANADILGMAVLTDSPLAEEGEDVDDRRGTAPT